MNLMKRILCFFVFLTMIIVVPDDVHASELKSKCKIAGLNPYVLQIEMQMPETGYCNYVEIVNANTKKVVYKQKTDKNQHSVWNLKYNKVYFCRVKQVSKNGTQTDGKWSEKRYFIHYKYSVYFTLSGFNIAMPRIKGVKKYNVYIAKKKKGPYKHIGSIKPGKKKELRVKKQGKHRIYFRVKPIVKRKKCYSQFDFNQYDHYFSHISYI